MGFRGALLVGLSDLEKALVSGNGMVEGRGTHQASSVHEWSVEQVLHEPRLIGR